MSDVTWTMDDDGVGVITLNRPEARNALTHGMYAELERLTRGASDAGVRCLVITGADPSFCSGDDVRQVMGGGEAGKAPVMDTASRNAAADARSRRAAAHQRARHRRRQRCRGRVGHGAVDDGRHPRRQPEGQVR